MPPIRVDLVNRRTTLIIRKMTMVPAITEANRQPSGV